jgi:hypothetical protein
MLVFSEAELAEVLVSQVYSLGILLLLKWLVVEEGRQKSPPKKAPQSLVLGAEVPLLLL